jgi:DNA polymerase elongation subunit (family B)
MSDTEALTSGDFEVRKPKTKILLFDIETAPNRGFVWGKWQQNVIEYVSEWYMLSWSAKWKDGRHITKCLADYDNYNPTSENDKDLVSDLWKLIDQADIIIAHNGDKFDIKRANTRFIEHGLKPPEPYRTVDTCKVARKHFNFNSNKLDDLGRRLEVGRKVKHWGFELWTRCMEGELKAWALMKKYNKADVLLLERVYEKMLPWIDNHPNVSVLDNEPDRCRNCGDTHLQRHGWHATPTGKQRRIVCMNCGTWMRGPHQKVTTIR